jgi:hypothetical protein
LGVKVGRLNSNEQAFREWILRNRQQVDIDFDFVQLNDPVLDWYRDVFSKSGPMPTGKLRELIDHTRSEILPAALVIFLREVDQEHRETLHVSVEESPCNVMSGRRCFYLLGRELYSMSISEALVEIGEVVQDEVIDRDQEVWPVCDRHQAGLHPRLVAGRAVWWCSPGDHVLRGIGTVSNLGEEGG